jgi:hypothetical protein
MQGEYISGFLITGPGGPDNSLPRPERPVDPGYGVDVGPVDPGYGVPLPPVVDNGLPSHPAPPIYIPGRPAHPIYPTYPVDPDYGLPVTPGVWPKPPIHVWPPPQPVYPTHPIYPTDQPEHPIAMPPGSVWPPLPPSVTGKILCFVWIVGVGYRWTVIDPSLKPDIGLPGDQPGIDNTLPPVHARPDHDLPPSAQPKR